MLPSIAKGTPSASLSERHPQRRVSEARLLDAALFDSAGWFAIDARNQRVPGVVVASLEAGLESVSYTHLDVYKRQPIDSAMTRWRTTGQSLR